MATHRTMPFRWIEEAEARRARDWARLALQEAGPNGTVPPRSFVLPFFARLWLREEGCGVCYRQPLRRGPEIAYDSDLPDRRSLGGPDGWSDAR
jgi:hypothetical protein